MIRDPQALRAFAALGVMVFHFSLLKAIAFPVYRSSFGVAARH
ncbi:MAG TPA: hypothetical protein VMH86_10335 [Rhizomicrobium sp.]|nr:hypothetical protein [Rhizomicrobium sp.]